MRRCKRCGGHFEEIDMSHCRDGTNRPYCKGCGGRNKFEYERVREEYAERFDAGLVGHRLQNGGRGRGNKTDAIEQALARQYAFSDEDYSQMTDDDWRLICAEAEGWTSVCEYGTKKAAEMRRQRQEHACTSMSN